MNKMEPHVGMKEKRFSVHNVGSSISLKQCVNTTIQKNRFYLFCFFLLQTYFE